MHPFPLLSTHDSKRNRSDILPFLRPRPARLTRSSYVSFVSWVRYFFSFRFPERRCGERRNHRRGEKRKDEKVRKIVDRRERIRGTSFQRPYSRPGFAELRESNSLPTSSRCIRQYHPIPSYNGDRQIYLARIGAIPEQPRYNL